MPLNKLALSLILLCTTFAMADDPAALKVTTNASTVSILAAERPILHYQRSMNPSKVYLRELFTPSGTNILRDSPFDHVHHHSLMYAIAADGVDFWTQGDTCGRQQPLSLGEVKITAGDGLSQAGFTQQIDWIAPDGDKKLAERRSIEVVQLEDTDVSLVTWRSHLQTAAGKQEVALSGSHYFGLGMRFVQSMDRVGRHFNADAADGPVVRGDEQVTPTKWSAYTAPLDGKTVTVAMFDHPDNARKAHFFTMLNPFSYVSATLNLSKEPMTLKAGTPLNLCYGVAVWDGQIEAAQIEKLYQRWSEIASAAK